MRGFLFGVVDAGFGGRHASRLLRTHARRSRRHLLQDALQRALTPPSLVLQTTQRPLFLRTWRKKCLTIACIVCKSEHTECFPAIDVLTSLTEFRHEMRSGNLPAYLSLNGPSNGSFMLLILFCSILALMSFRWRIIMFLVLFCFISVEISEIQLVCDGRTDGPTDRRTDGHTLL